VVLGRGPRRTQGDGRFEVGTQLVKALGMGTNGEDGAGRQRRWEGGGTVIGAA